MFTVIFVLFLSLSKMNWNIYKIFGCCLIEATSTATTAKKWALFWFLTPSSVLFSCTVCLAAFLCFSFTELMSIDANLNANHKSQFACLWGLVLLFLQISQFLSFSLSLTLSLSLSLSLSPSHCYSLCMFDLSCQFLRFNR